MTKNFVGIESHITDEYVHWNQKDRIEKMRDLRWLYDKALSGDDEALDKLLSEVYIAGMDAGDQNIL